MKVRISRRTFLVSALASSAFPFIASRTSGGRPSPNDRLNIGVIGVANRGAANLNGVAGENVVALCDVDQNYLSAAGDRFPEAKQFADFRDLLDQRDIDAVVISTTDHTHAVATVMALRSGRHVYCEKPLTHTVSEARIVANTARETKRATQMGNQIHAGTNYRRVVELIQAGAIGPVREVHCWAGSVWSGFGRTVEHSAVPPHLNWDLWLGPAQELPYSAAYVPAAWRGWWRFGGGAMADMACHHIDLPFWALNLRQPTSVQSEGPELHKEFAPEWQMVHYEFPQRDSLPPVKLTWYNGDKRPEYFNKGQLPKWGNGTLFVGDKGMLLADYGNHVLLPESDFVDFQRPAPSIPDSIGHYAEWIEACKSGGPTTCNFDYAGALTETVLLGNVAYRSGKKLLWDSKNLVATNAPEAAQFIQHHYRNGWSLKG